MTVPVNEGEANGAFALKELLIVDISEFIVFNEPLILDTLEAVAKKLALLPYNVSALIGFISTAEPTSVTRRNADVSNSLSSGVKYNSLALILPFVSAASYCS